MQINFLQKAGFTFILSIIIVLNANSQNSASEILQDLNKLKVFGSVLYVAAHPDDENTRLLSYLANERKYRTAYLALTRGDGGQNLVGKEQGELLGMIRTQELLAARRIDGAEQFFTRANDFGYSKNPGETFQFWDKEKVLADVVWVIRNFKPDVIITRFPTTGEGGHGHHTASAILALEAFEAAANPTRFPEQLKYVPVWQAKRIFWNTFNFGETNTTSAEQLKLNVGLYNPLLGKSYGEIAAISRTNHKSQGFGSAKQRGDVIEYFKLLNGEPTDQDLFEGINTAVGRLQNTSDFEQQINNIIKNFDSYEPEKSVSDLFNLQSTLKKIPDTYWKSYKLNQLNIVIEKCLGLFTEITTTSELVSPSGKIKINPFVVSRNSDIVLKNIQFLNLDTAYNINLVANENFKKEWSINLPNDIKYSSPYYLEEPAVSGLYTVKDLLKISKPEVSNELFGRFVFNYNGNELMVYRPVQYKKVDPVKGEIYQDLAILPEVFLSFNQKTYLNNQQSVINVSAKVHATKAMENVDIQLNLPQGWTSDPKVIRVNFFENALIQEVSFKVYPKVIGQQIDEMQLEARIAEKKFSQDLYKIQYDHIPNRYLLSNASAKLISLDLKMGPSNIAYIMGSDDDVPSSLEAAGYKVTILTPAQIADQDLKTYNAIVFGIRAFNTHDELFETQTKLMNYIYSGGIVVCQYNTNSFFGSIKKQIGPYPFKIGRDRVTDEKADIRFIDPKNDLLNYPNKISKKDFDSWIQERGLYFPTQLDSNYKTIISCNDPGEAPLDNSIIYCNYGKGKFIYTGLSFFRELPAGVPGAYRLFSNLLAGGKK